MIAKQKTNSPIDTVSVTPDKTIEDNVDSYNVFGFAENNNDNLQQPCAFTHAFDVMGTDEASVEKSSNYGLSKKEVQFARAVEIIQEISPNEAKSLCYYPPYLSKTTLPVSKTADLQYTRMNGDIKLSLIGDPSKGLPYGTIARKIIAHLTTYSVLNKTRMVPVASKNALLKDLGAGTGGDKTKKLDDMLYRLIGATMIIDVAKKQDSEDINIGRCGIIDSICIEKNNAQGNYILLDHKFYELCQKSASPLDSRVLKVLSSSIQFDVYVFLMSRLVGVRQTTRISWRSFMDQFGICSANHRAAKQNLKKAIDKIRIIQPKMNVTYTNDMVILSPSISPIKTKKGRYINSPEPEADEVDTDTGENTDNDN